MMRNMILMLAVLALVGCNRAGQSQYNWQDVGKSTNVEFGTVVAVREVQITGPNSGVGAMTGIGAGAIAGSSFGSGNGQLGAALAGIVIGGLAGAAAEQAMSDHSGVEYTITMKSGQTVTVTQNITPGEVPIAVGSRVMVQQSGMYHRVLPAKALPTKIKRPKDIKVQD